MESKFGVVGILDKCKVGDLPGNQMVNIVLNSYSSSNDGTISITPQLATDVEVDNAVNQLINDLEKARVAAKKSIKTINEKIRTRT